MIDYWDNHSKFFWFRITEKWNVSIDHYWKWWSWNIWSWFKFEWINEETLRRWFHEFDQTEESNHKYEKLIEFLEERKRQFYEYESFSWVINWEDDILDWLDIIIDDDIDNYENNEEFLKIKEYFERLDYLMKKRWYWDKELKDFCINLFYWFLLKKKIEIKVWWSDVFIVRIYKEDIEMKNSIKIELIYSSWVNYNDKWNYEKEKIKVEKIFEWIKNIVEKLNFIYNDFRYVNIIEPEFIWWNQWDFYWYISLKDLYCWKDISSFETFNSLNNWFNSFRNLNFKWMLDEIWNIKNNLSTYEESIEFLSLISNWNLNTSEWYISRYNQDDWNNYRKYFDNFNDTEFLIISFFMKKVESEINDLINKLKWISVS